MGGAGAALNGRARAAGSDLTAVFVVFPQCRLWALVKRPLLAHSPGPTPPSSTQSLGLAGMWVRTLSNSESTAPTSIARSAPMCLRKAEQKET